MLKPLTIAVLCISSIGSLVAIPQSRAEDNATSSSASDKHNWGPSLALGFPHPFTIGGDWRSPEREWSLGAAFGFFPNITLKVGSDKTPVAIGLKSFDLRGRWHPWKGAFFVGTALGQQKISASATKAVNISSLKIPGYTTTPVTINAELKTLFFTPHLGWMWTLDNGLFFGLEGGIQFALSSSSEFNVTSSDPLTEAVLGLVKLTADYQTLKSRTEDGMNKIGKINLPYITLFKIGYLF